MMHQSLICRLAGLINHPSGGTWVVLVFASGPAPDTCVVDFSFPLDLPTTGSVWRSFQKPTAMARSFSCSTTFG